MSLDLLYIGIGVLTLLIAGVFVLRHAFSAVKSIKKPDTSAGKPLPNTQDQLLPQVPTALVPMAEVTRDVIVANAAEEQARSLLHITVSRENISGPLAFEQVLSTIHSIYNKKKTVGAERISLEIAISAGQIGFYLWAPKEAKSLMESQLYAHYPEIVIQEVEDYLPESLEGKSYTGTSLTLAQPYMYPIRQYKQFEDKMAGAIVDPLSSLTSPLAHIIDKDDIATIEIILAPLDPLWAKNSIKIFDLMESKAFKYFKAKEFETISWYLQKRTFWQTVMNAPKLLLIGFLQFKTKPNEKKIVVSMERGSESREDTLSNAIASKLSKLAFYTTIRLGYITKPEFEHLAASKLSEIKAGFNQFNIPHLNSFQASDMTHSPLEYKSLLKRESTLKNENILNTEEVATIYHLPTVSVNTPNIMWVKSKTLEPPFNLPAPEDEDVTILGETKFRNIKKRFGIKLNDRRRHIYIIGKTGMGKSTILENMIYSDLQSGHGMAVIDPHGDLAEAALNYVPTGRTNDVIYFAPGDVDYPVGFNMLENVPRDLRSLVASGIVGIFKKLFESWGPRLEHTLRNTIFALLEMPGATMLSIPRMLTDKFYRAKVLEKVTDPVIKQFWEEEFNKLQEKQIQETISPILNKVGQFLSSPIIRNIIGQPVSTINIRTAMDEGKILIINLSKGKIGEDNSALLGSMLITKFQIDAMSRADTEERLRRDFFLYVDEFQNFATDSFATILSEARKYRLNLTMANQYIMQMKEEVKYAVFGNVGTIISFAVGPDDATYLSEQYSEEVSAKDLTSQEIGSIYTRLMIDGMPSKTFSSRTLLRPQFDNVDTQDKEKILKVTRERHANKRDFVEHKIKQWVDQLDVVKNQGEGEEKKAKFAAKAASAAYNNGPMMGPSGPRVFRKPAGDGMPKSDAPIDPNEPPVKRDKVVTISPQQQALLERLKQHEAKKQSSVPKKEETENSKKS